MFPSLKQAQEPVLPKKRYEQGRGDLEDCDSSRDGSISRGFSPPPPFGKRKCTDRDPESPGDIDDDSGQPHHHHHHRPTQYYAKKERDNRYLMRERMETDSPSSYPRHVTTLPTSEEGASNQHHRHPHDVNMGILPYSEPVATTPSRNPLSAHPAHNTPTQALTPDSASIVGSGGMHAIGGYSNHEQSPYIPRHSYYPEPSPFHGGSGGAPLHPPPHYRGPNHVVYPPTSEMGMYGGPGYQQRDYARGGPNRQQGHDPYLQPKRWSCDYCSIATFLSYEEACAHEEGCSRRHGQDQFSRLHPRPPPPISRYSNLNGGGAVVGGLGALYHAGQELGTPNGATSPGGNRAWNARTGSGLMLPLFPSERPPYGMMPPRHHNASSYPGDYRNYEPEDLHHHHSPHNPYHHHHRPLHRPQHPHRPSANRALTADMEQQRRRILLSLPGDSDSLSDRQCYVRTHMVEIFASTEKDVAARHTKGAQKLVAGQVGIQCVHCAHLRPRDRKERAVCYPSSISRIYQTVADMQRFHFEQCNEISDEVRKIYKSLKTTRPRGVGSPQTYWIHSAEILGLVDTKEGIRFNNGNNDNKNQL